MQEIRCDNDNRFLARVASGNVEIFCPKCKTFHVVELSQLVRLAVLDLKHAGDDVRLFV